MAREAVRKESLHVGAFMLLLLSTLTACGGRPPAPPAPADPESCCREFDFLLEVTILKIDVARLFLRVDQETALQVAAIVSSEGRTRDSELAVRDRLMRTREAQARLTFLLDITTQQFQATAEKTLQDLGAAGWLTSDEVDRLMRSSRQDLAFLGDSGIADGDYIGQVLGGDSVTTTFANENGELRFHAVRVGREQRIAMLGSYFAETSDFSAGLLDQVFGRSRAPDQSTFPLLAVVPAGRPTPAVPQ